MREPLRCWDKGWRLLRQTWLKSVQKRRSCDLGQISARLLQGPRHHPLDRSCSKPEPSWRQVHTFLPLLPIYAADSRKSQHCLLRSRRVLGQFPAFSRSICAFLRAICCPRLADWASQTRLGIKPWQNLLGRFDSQTLRLSVFAWVMSCQHLEKWRVVQF